MSLSSMTDRPAEIAAGPEDYAQLLKPRVMSLVIFTALVGMVAGADAARRAGADALDPRLAIIALLAIALGAGASGALNMWRDADIDALMARTANRPVPRGVIAARAAGGFGLILSVAAVTLLWLASNPLAAGLLAFTIFFYAVIYTIWLKRTTPQNIVIGGAAGALPPVVGWAAATGAAPLEAWSLFLLIFLWTPPHFWALALFRSTDYARAGVPMLPVVKGPHETRRQIFAYAVLTALAGLAPAGLGLGGPVYGLVAVAMGAAFVWLAWALWRAPATSSTFAAERRLFGYSILYLFALFAVLLIETLWSLYA